MLNKFNTDKLNIMEILRSLCKYLLIVVIFIFFLSSVIQTATYIQIYLSGDFSIDNSPTMNIDEESYNRVSGKAYLTTLGTAGRERGWDVHYEEDAWAEVGSRKHNVEEMDEGPYSCTADEFFSNGCSIGYVKNAFSETDDEWTPELRYHESEIRSLYHNGWVEIDFEPTPLDLSQGDFYVGFTGNPENNYRNAYKDPVESTDDIRNGFGLFLLAVPSAESYVKEVNIRSIGGDPSIPGNITFKTPINKDDINCVGGSCTIDYNADFISPCNRKGWFSEGNFAYTNYGKPNAAYSTDDLTDCISFSSAYPYKIQMAENTATTGYDYKYAMAVIPLSPSSAFKSNNCRFCFSSNSKTSYLWNDIFAWFQSRDSDTYNAITGSSMTSTNAQYYDAVKKIIDTSDEGGYTYDLPNNIDRSRSPVAFAFGYSYRGGDSWVWQADHFFAGHYLIVTDTISSEYQIEVDFAQIGVNIFAQSEKGIVDGFLFTESGKFINQDSPQWVYSNYDTETVTFYDKNEFTCMYDILEEKIQSVSGDDEMQIKIETDNILQISTENAVSVSKPTPETYFSLPADQVNQGFYRTPITITESIPRTVTMHANYKYYITNFDPAFQLTTTQDSWVNTDAFNIGGFTNIVHIQPESTTIDGIEQMAFDSYSPSNQGFDSNNQSCAFPEHLQELFVTPKITETDLYYVDALITTNAYVFTQHPDSGNWRRYTQSDFQFDINTVTFLAQALSTNNSEVIAQFKPFPTVYLASYIGSKLEGQVTSNPFDTNLDKDAGDIFLVQNESRTNFTVQPLDSFELTFNSKLERLGIYGEDNGYIGLYKMSSVPEEDAIDGTDVTYQSQIYPLVEIGTDPIESMPDGTGVTVNISNKDITLGLAKTLVETSDPDDPEYEYRLSIDSIEDNFLIFIDFTPYIVNLYTTVIDPTTATVTENIATDTGSSIYISPDTADYINTFKKAKNNEEFAIEVNLESDNITYQFNRQDYYIFDVLETYYISSDEPPSVNSRINENYNTLSSATNQFVNFNTYASSSIAYETDIQFLIEKYKTVELVFNEFGSVEHDFSGLVLPGDSDYGNSRTYSTELPSETFILKPNNIYIIGGTAEVGFRRFDNLNLNLIPNPGYYIKSVYLTIDENLDGDFDDEEDVSANILSTLPDFNDAVSAKSVEILTVSKNIKVEVDFQEKPSMRTYFLSPFY